MHFTLRGVLLLLLCFLMISSCSSSDDPEETGIIEQTTDKIAQKAISSIKTPIEQAKLAREIQENHNRKIEETIEAQ